MAKAPYTTEDGADVYTTKDGDHYTTAPVIQPGGSRYGGPRKNWQEIEWAQHALQEVAYALYGGDPPKRVKKRFLIDRANEWLLSDPEYMATGYGNTSSIVKSDKGKISDRTMLRAWKKAFPLLSLLNCLNCLNCLNAPECRRGYSCGYLNPQENKDGYQSHIQSRTAGRPQAEA
jgi:hypothetical protein